MTVWLIFRQDILALRWRWAASRQLWNPRIYGQFLNRARPFPANYLESAAFVFHMSARDLENHQVLASRVF